MFKMADNLTKEEIIKMKKKELVNELKKRQIHVSGNKTDLQEKLLTMIEQERNGYKDDRDNTNQNTYKKKRAQSIVLKENSKRNERNDKCNNDDNNNKDDDDDTEIENIYDDDDSDSISLDATIINNKTAQVVQTCAKVRSNDLNKYKKKQCNDIDDSDNKSQCSRSEINKKHRKKEYETEYESTDEEYESAVASRKNLKLKKTQNDLQRIRKLITFQDLENTLDYFTGNDKINITAWIDEFESFSAKLAGWTDIEMVIYGKRMLKDTALQFVRMHRHVNTWAKLKMLLLKEFENDIDSSIVHDQLRKRIKKPDESLKQYFYAMHNIALQIDLEIPALLRYVVDGIIDDTPDKLILEGVKSIKELKEKFLIYEKLKEKRKAKQNKYVDNVKHANRVKPNKNLKCFNCGDDGHESKSCPNKHRGPKCFGCNLYGHKSSMCPKKNKDSSMANVNFISKKVMYKTIKVNDLNCTALIDTGSDLTLIKARLLKEINADRYKKHMPMVISGVGANITTTDSCQVRIQLDDIILEDVEMHVITNDLMIPDIIIGMDIICQLKVSIDENGATFTSKNVKRKDETEHCFLANIELTADDNNLIDIGEVNNQSVKDQIQNLIKNYKPIEVENTEIKMKIIMSDDEPVQLPARRLQLPEHKIVEKQVAEWLENGVIQMSTSDYSSPVVLVEKKDGSKRLCIDYRKVNKKIIKDRHPLPRIDDQIDKLRGAKYFTTLDLANGFFHVSVDEASRKYTAFITPSGCYEFRKVPFGLCNSAGVFQRYINHIYRNEINNGIMIVYVDDIIIPSNTLDEGLNHLKQVLKTASNNGLRIKWEKCHFLKRRIEYLGHVIENGKVSPSEAKTAAVINFPEPNSIQRVQSFLGLVGYFRKFIKNFALISKPLSDMLRGDAKFKFDDEQRLAFSKLKQLLKEKPVLHIFQYGATTELHTDASKDGLGGILLQVCPEDNQLHPIYYWSRKTSAVEQNYSSYELEVLAIIEAVKKFRVYLIGQHFKIVTDCKAFTQTMQKRDLTTKIARWAMMLEDFHYTVEHRSGNQMKHVDALSRNPVVMQMYKMQTITCKLRISQENDDQIAAIIEILKMKPYKDFVMENGILCKIVDGQPLFVVPESMKDDIVKEIHEKGHFHQKKMIDLIEKEFYIPDVRRRIEKCIQSCIKCILAERKMGKAEGFLNPIPKGDVPLDTMHVDFLGPMTTTGKNYKYILVVIDAFTKFTWLFPTKTLTAEEVLQKLEVITNLFGYPRQIIGDKGGAFISKKFQDFCVEKNIILHLVTTGTPRGNGQVERVHQVVITLLTKLSLENTEKWYKHVAKVQNFINSTYHRTIKTSPFELMLGIKMRHEKDENLIEIIEEEKLDAFQEGRSEIRERARQEILNMQRENKRQYDKRRKKPLKYNVGDLVAIARTQFGTNLKIKPKFFGPYRITNVGENDRYDVIKEGEHEGPYETSTSVDKMKRWPEVSSGADDSQDGRVW